LIAFKGPQKGLNSVIKTEILFRAVKNFLVVIVVVLLCFYVIPESKWLSVVILTFVFQLNLKYRLPFQRKKDENW